MEKAKLVTWAYWIMILVVIATCIFVIIYFKGHGDECLANPIGYAESLSKQDCFCVQKFVP